MKEYPIPPLDKLIRWLKGCKEGCWVENDAPKRCVEKVNMVGGQYLMFDELGRCYGLTANAEEAAKYVLAIPA